MTVKDATPRPRSVSIALLLITASWTISMALVAWRMLVTRPLVNGQRPLFAMSLVFIIIVIAVSGGLLAALVYRRRWAYIVWLVLSALALTGVVSGAGQARQAFANGPLSASWYVLSLAIQVTALVLLLRRPGREWYGISRPPAPPGEWRPDPSGRHQHRYWDGSGWTEQVADDGVAGVDPATDSQGGVPLTSASS